MRFLDDKNTKVVTSKIYKAVAAEVTSVALWATGSYLENHGIKFYMDEKCERRCRGTDCFIAYYPYTTGWGTY